MKYLLMLDTPFWMFLCIALTVYIVRLRHQIAGLDDPRMWLTRKERRALARKTIQDAAERRQNEEAQAILREFDTHKGFQA